MNTAADEYVLPIGDLRPSSPATLAVKPRDQLPGSPFNETVAS
jgi:hypothetical protein